MNFYKLSMAAVMLAAGSVCVAAETATEYEKIGFLCSDGIGLNGVNPGWNTGSPYVVSKSDDGMFRF